MSVGTVCSNNFTSMMSSSGVQQRRKDFEALTSAVKSGDIAGAQTALTTFEQDLQGALDGSQTSQTQSTPAQDLKALQDAFSANDLTSAQKSFSALLEDLKQAKSHHHHHRHYHQVDQSSDTSATSTSTSTSTDSTSASSSGTSATSINITA
jgi:hypothetical protein